jgi:LytS/YehU family sensor histidine kinase
VFAVDSPPFLEVILRYPYLFDGLTYWAVVGVHAGLSDHWAYLKEDLRTSKLKESLMQAQVQVLKMQLHPHFLFNTLNSISELMHEDMEAAEKMLKRLEDFLRITFQNSDVQEISLEKELEFLRNYLDIQQVRFQNRLKVDLSIDPQALQDRVPNMILQPIVENAIRHGVAPRVDSGRVEIRALHKQGNLLLEVEDDGPGLTTGSYREGIGMSNTRMRLEQIYGDECLFRVRNHPGGGLVVTLQIPSNTEASREL